MWIAAILDLWRHFRPPSWICDVTSGRHLGFPVTWLPNRKSRDHKMTGGHVTGNPRWRPEVTSQIQDGGRKWRHKSKMAAIHIIHSRTKWFPQGLAKRKSRDRKSKMATGNDVTNPRWRPEVTSLIQDGGNHLLLISFKNSPQGLAKRSYDQEVCFQFGIHRATMISNHIFENQTELESITIATMPIFLLQLGINYQWTMMVGDQSHPSFFEGWIKVLKLFQNLHMNI